jgi:hypothetical protein
MTATLKTLNTGSWSSIWERALPVLAVVGPATWLLAALVRVAELGTLPGALSWASQPEGFIMVLGVSFFAATFVMLGRRVAERSPRSGVAVTAMGMLGVAPLAAVSFIRLFMANFVAAGLDPNLLNRAFESPSLWYAGFFVLNAAQFLAWIIAGVSLLRSGAAPKWAAVSLILGVVSVVTAQGAYVALEVFWPLGCALWTIGAYGVAFRPATPRS